MIRINLLPAEFKIAQAKKEQKVILGVAGGFFVSLMMLVWLIQNHRASSLQEKVAEAEAELNKYQAIVAQIEQIEADKKRLLAKRDVINNLNKSRILYPVFFEDLLPIIPSDVWISNMQVAEQGSQMKITMSSNALSNFALATWLSNLQQSTHFSGVELGPISYSASTQDGTNVLSFTLTCMYQHSGPFPLSQS